MASARSYMGSGRSSAAYKRYAQKARAAGDMSAYQRLSGMANRQQKQERANRVSTAAKRQNAISRLSPAELAESQRIANNQRMGATARRRGGAGGGGVAIPKNPNS